MRNGYLLSAVGHLREARALLTLGDFLNEADEVETLLHRCGAIQRALQRSRDLQREAQRLRKATVRRGAVRS